MRGMQALRRLETSTLVQPSQKFRWQYCRSLSRTARLYGRQDPLLSAQTEKRQWSTPLAEQLAAAILVCRLETARKFIEWRMIC